jgi:hypothetical protein
LTPILGVIASAISGNLDASGFFPIATYTAPTSVANITFSGIPQTYTHLQLRMTLRSTAANNYGTISINSGSYRQHNVFATGTAPFTVNSATSTDIVPVNRSDSTALFFSASIMDIEDYSSTTRYKTIRALNASQRETATTNGYMWLASMLSANTSAVTSITITPSSGSFAQYSQATLYAWK